MLSATNCYLTALAALKNADDLLTDAMRAMGRGDGKKVSYEGNTWLRNAQSCVLAG